MIMAALGCRVVNKAKLKIAGVILSGGIVPEKQIMDLLNKAEMPVLLARADTYTVSSSIHDLTVKIRPEDKNKIDTVIKLIQDNVDLESILKGM
jgi:BioD-like phosphotransacetylase family protein